MTRSLAIIGASGHGKVLADIAQLVGWRTIAFFDDEWPARQVHSDWLTCGTTSEFLARINEFDGAALGIGNNTNRSTKASMLLRRGIVLPTLIHPKAIVSMHSGIDCGSIVCAGAVVGVASSVGRFCIVNSNAVVEHDCILEDGVHVSPGAAVGGGVRIGALSWVGIGASIKHGVRIGRDVIIGGGAMVVKDIADHHIALGVPARAIPRRSEA